MEIKGNVLMQRYDVGKLLGKGTFAKVYHARDLKTGVSVAIKMIDKEKVLKVGMTDQLEREISSMRLVQHPNVVQLYEVLATKTKIYMVMEYVKGGELFTKVARGKLKESAARKYFQQLISAIDFCHSRGVYHRDLKPENLLVDEKGNLKVSDFGLSAIAGSKGQDGLLNTMCGTPAYAAPDVLCRRAYDGCKADMWSCGVILFVLLAGYLPFRDSNLMEMYRKIGKAEYKCPNWISPDARKLISRILDPNPNTRISISKIKENPWFRKGLLHSKGMKTDVDPEHESGIDMKAECAMPKAMNAFEIISLSAGLDLSGLFAGEDEKTEFKFTSNQPAKTIFSKLEGIAKGLKLKVTKKDGGLLRFEGSTNNVWKGALSMDAEVIEVAPNFHLVEMKKSNGDTLEYQKMVKQDIRPSLEDIVWAWEGEEPSRISINV